MPAGPSQPGALNPDTGFGSLTVNGQSMFTSAWCISDMSAILDDAVLRGLDRLVPSAVGVLPQRRRRTVTRKDFPMFITGRFNSAGIEYGPDKTDWERGLVTNCLALLAALGIGEDAPAGVAGTVNAVWALPGGGSKSAAVHVLSPFKLVNHLYLAQGVLSLEIPAGKFS